MLKSIYLNQVQAPNYYELWTHSSPFPSAYRMRNSEEGGFFYVEDLSFLRSLEPPCKNDIDYITLANYFHRFSLRKHFYNQFTELIAVQSLQSPQNTFLWLPCTFVVQRIDYQLLEERQEIPVFGRLSYTKIPFRIDLVTLPLIILKIDGNIKLKLLQISTIHKS